MSIPVVWRAVTSVLAAAAGVVVVHTVDYTVLFPHAQARTAHLDATGHGYWPVAVTVATAAALIALLLTALAGLRRDLHRAPGRPACNDFGRLLLGQGAAFVLLEAAERGVTGHPLEALLSSPELWVGLAVQVPVAWLAVRLLRLVEHTASLMAGSRGRRRVSAAPVLRASLASAPPPRLLSAASTRPRAPPLLA